MERKGFEHQHEKQLDREIDEREREMDMQETKKLSCKKCGSHFVYVRIKEGSVVCRSCGNIDQLDQ